MSLANQFVDEGTIATHHDIDYPIPVRRIVIINDSSTISLKFRINEGQDWATLKANETVQMEGLRVPTLHLSGNGAVYRVWALG